MTDLEALRVVGLSYDPAQPGPPVVVVKGAGLAARHILEDARRDSPAPVVRDEALAAQLYRVPVDAAIGRELFPVMAALLAHLLFVDGKLKEK